MPPGAALPTCSGDKHKLGSAFPAPCEVQEEKPGWSKQDQHLSCSRLLLQERCLPRVSQPQTHLAAALLGSFPHLLKPGAA